MQLRRRDGLMGSVLDLGSGVHGSILDVQQRRLIHRVAFSAGYMGSSGKSPRPISANP